MPGKLIFALHAEGMQLHCSKGSLFHGALMEMLPRQYAEILHEQELRPFSQSIYYDRQSGKSYWRFCFLQEECRMLIGNLLKERTQLHIHHNGATVFLQLQSEETRSYEAMMDGCFLPQLPPIGAKLTFLTPTAFKQNGSYTMLSEPKLMLNSLLERWNSANADTKISEDKLHEKLGEMVRITRYNLRTLPFSLEGRNIYGFQGELWLRFQAQEMQKRLLGLLFDFAGYAGIGIKTALGMGAVNSELIYDKIKR